MIVEWESLWTEMMAMGFPQRFASSRGLRHGNHISSYLFILVLEIFNGLMRKASGSTAFRFHPKCEQLSRHLSLGGRAKLVRSSIFDIQNFLCANLPIPKYVVEEVEKRVRCFLWSGKDEGPYRAKVSWSTACLPLVEGGLAFKGMAISNQVCLCLCLFGMKTGALWGPVWYVLSVQEKSSIQLSSDISLRDALPLKLPGMGRQTSMLLRLVSETNLFSFSTGKDKWVCDSLVDGKFMQKNLWEDIKPWLRGFFGLSGFGRVRITCFSTVVILLRRGIRECLGGGSPVSADFIYHKVVSIVHDRACSWRGIKRTKVNWEISLDWGLGYCIFLTSQYS
ncbi:hypothetical protein LIER_20978 [Lithospermum erythrorhizon]|uniref:Uncharacterized protein n=1 Tax=Lithospermum erythrorhizon TaxID=34254 RepID=A0AAV3QU78_LITER